MRFMKSPPIRQVDRRELAKAVIEHQRVIEAMRHPDFQLFDEEFSLIDESIRRLERLGMELDPCLRALIHVLRRQMMYTDNDPDMDGPQFFPEIEHNSVFA